MKQRAIKRCIKRVQKKLARVGHRGYKGKLLGVTMEARGVVFAPLESCSVHIQPNGRVRYTNFGLRIDGDKVHQHWLGNQRCAVAVSYAK